VGLLKSTSRESASQATRGRPRSWRALVGLEEDIDVNPGVDDYMVKVGGSNEEEEEDACQRNE
jgi:hypothetical protein